MQRVFLLCLAASFVACSPKGKKESVVSNRKPGTGLGLNGYNYTDLPIESYVVNGAGGGAVRVSTNAGGGGGTTCCMDAPKRLPATYRVRWSRDRDRWCELDVEFKGPIPKNSIFFNTHFFQDGHVEVSISDDWEPARVNLPSIQMGLMRHSTGNSINDDKLARCKDER